MEDRKLVLLLIPLIALPSIVLAVFAVNALSGQRDIIERGIQDSYSPLVKRTCQEIVEAFDAKEQKIFQRIRDSMQEDEERRFASFEIPDPFFAHTFIIDSQYNVIYPQLRPSEPSTDYFVAESYSKSEEDGHRYEFVEREYHKAIVEYDKVIDEQRNESVGRAYLAKARCYRKLGEQEKAIEVYQNLAKKVGYDTPMGLNFIVLAKLEIVKIRKIQGQWSSCYRALLALLEEIIYNEYLFQPGRYNFFYDEIDQLVEQLKSLSELPQPLQQEFQEQHQNILQRRKKIQTEEKMVKSLQLNFVELIRQRISYGDTFGYIWYSKEEEALIYYQKVALATNQFYVVYLIDLAYCVNDIFIPIFKEQQLEKEILLTIVDNKQSPILGTEEQQLTPIVSLPIDPKLPFWQVAIYLKNVGSLHELTQSRSYLYFGGIFIIILVLFVGVYGSLSAFIREVKSARLKSDFVSNVTHELKTPLTAIKMFVETLLMDRAQSPEEREEYLQIIAAESERLSKLIDRILDFAKMEKNKRTFNFSKEDLGELVEDTVAQFQKQIVGGECQLKVEVEKGLPETMADREALSEALLNLLSNAYKYSDRKNRQIEITCKRHEESIAISVQDNGCGIPRSEFDRIFQKFYRVQGPKTKNIEGTGLGLALVDSIVKAHHGKIKVRSKIGEGSKFTIKLPLQYNRSSS